MIKEYDRIRLKTGERGQILEILDDDTYLAEIISKEGDVDTTEIKKTAIKAIIVEHEKLLV